MEILVVDNGSQDESVSRLSMIENIHLLPLQRNYGFARGSNVGIRKALEQGIEYVLLLNNDTEFPEDFIQPLFEPFQIDSRACVVSPKILYHEPAQVVWYAGGKFHQPRIIGELVGMGTPDQKQYDLMRKTDFGVGTCMLIKCNIFDQIGVLDERFFFYHEDVDFCYRAIKAGYSIWYQPKSVIKHKVSSSTKDQPDMRLFLYQQARVIFLFKHIRGYKIPLVIFMEGIRVIRVIIDGMMHLSMKYPYSYLNGLIAGLKESRRYYS
jgi:hypothetical protein